MNAPITFRAKIEVCGVMGQDDSHDYERIRVPVLRRSHCDMAWFRSSARFSAFANSTLFPGILARLRRELVDSPSSDYIRLGESLGSNIRITRGGFLATVELFPA